MIVGLICFVLAFAAAALVTLPARRLALAANLVAPVRADRLHREVRPYGGGIALILSTVFALGAARVLLPTIHDHEVNVAVPFLGRLAVGAVLFFMLGLVDDRYALSAWPKLFLQAACATVVVAGLDIRGTFWLRSPVVSESVSILWIVAVVNAYNMLDHADGLAAAVGAVALGAMAYGQTLMFGETGGNALAVAPAMAAAGALAGFLIYNIPHARLFMGDAGSMFVGYLLAALALAGQYFFQGSTPSRLVVLIPLAILAVPLFDMVCVTLSRIRRRQSPFRGDATSHLAHRMLARGWSPRGIVAFAAAASAVTGGASVTMYFLSGPALLLPWLAVAAVLVTMLLVRRPVRPEATL